MKKIILVLIMMLVASVGYGKKYKDNVASRIIMTVKINDIGMDAANEFVANLRKKGIKPIIRYKMSGDEKWLVKVEDIRLKSKVEFNSLDEAGVTECFALLYDKLEKKKNDEKRYKIDEKCDDVYAIQEKYEGRSYGRVRERDYAAEGAWRFSVYRLTGNPSWLAW